MLSSWDKVHNFLNMMDIPDIHSSLPFSSTSSSSSARSESNQRPLAVSARSWLVGEKTTQKILSVIQPTIDSESRRKEIIEYLQRLIVDSFGIKVFPFGSVPFKTYLPHGDIDLTAVSYYGTSQDLAAEICTLLENEEKNNINIPVRDVLCVPAQVRVVKCTVHDIAVDISFNQTAGLCALYFLEQVDQFIGKDHLFKLSVILIKAWCYYESRLLGGFHGLISTYALETMILHVINLFHSLLPSPLAVLYKFLEYYSTFDWKHYCIGVNGLVLISSLPEIKVVSLGNCDELLLTEEFLRSSREALLPSTGDAGTKSPTFPIKFLNILDPLRDDNNLGRSVGKGNFHRIKSALSYGFQKLSDILILPPKELRAGLESFFNNILERNGKGKRVDALIPVPPYGSESSVTENDNIDLLSGMQYGLWRNDYAMSSYPVWPATSVPGQIRNTGWGELGVNIQYDQNPYCYVDESLSVNHAVEEKWKPRKQPFSTDCPRAPQLNNLNINEKGKARGMFSSFAPSVEEKWKSRGLQLNNTACFEERKKLRRSSPFAYNSRALWLTNAGSQHDNWRSRGIVSSVYHHDGPLLSNSVSRSSGTCVFLPLFEKPLHENLIFDKDEVKQEIGKANEEESEILGSLASTPKESNISSDKGESSCSMKYSVDEFPLLPGSQPIPIRSPPLPHLKVDQVKETSVSFDSTEFESCKPSSPASLSFSEAGKQSDSSDVSVFLDALSELTITVAISEEDKGSLKNEEIKVVSGERLQLTDESEFPPKCRAVSVEPLQLTDESEFPPLACPPKPVMPLCKKEFPPLRACLRSKKKSKGRRV